MGLYRKGPLEGKSYSATLVRPSSHAVERIGQANRLWC